MCSTEVRKLFNSSPHICKQHNKSSVWLQCYVLRQFHIQYQQTNVTYHITSGYHITSEVSSQ